MPSDHQADRRMFLHAGAVVLNSDFYKSTSPNILFEICTSCHSCCMHVS